MTERSGLFAGEDPFTIARRWLDEAEANEPNDPNAMALATVDGDGLPDVRMVLLKAVEPDALVFYTNYESAKARQIEESGVAACVLHWKSLRRQIRVRGRVERADDASADAYFASRSLQSRIGAWASRQSRPLESRGQLMAEVARQGLRHGANPSRPPFWGGYRILPVQFEFWADGAFRLHDRFQWLRNGENDGTGREVTSTTAWTITRLSP